ncbi:MAG: DUF4124 domain-containing protein [Pseudomonadota bacterium]|nr:DUF4124 domain-containing protein [Pseudomonadota bacterium]
MKAWIAFALLLAAASSATTAIGGTNSRKTYKWVDERGVTHYGDHIPPEFASQEQRVINSQGIETERVEAQKSSEQLAAEEQQRGAAAVQASRDRNLLNTYSSVGEIERLRDQRVNLLTDQIKVTGQFLEILNGQMKRLAASSMRFRPYSSDPHAPPMSDQIAEDLVRVSNDIRTQIENLHEKQSEEATMSAQFDSDIARFKELRGLH